jgi:membrane protein
MPRVKEWVSLVKESGRQWLEHKAPRLGAALAYYTAFALAPLLLISIAVAGLVFGREATEGRIMGQVQGLVGAQGGQALQAMIAGAQKPSAGIWATVLGIIMLLFGAAGVFGQLQDALNTVWQVQPKPGRGFLGFIKDRFLSISMVLGTAFLLLVSLVLSAALAAIGGPIGDLFIGVFGQILNFLISFVVITALFAMIYRYLPDAIIAWRDVWFGAVATALLFVIGKTLIGLYLGYVSVGSSYGAVGSLAVLLIWLYYSAQIFLYGAELTKSYASHFGSRIVPAPNAEPMSAAQRAQEGIPESAPPQQRRASA